MEGKSRDWAAYNAHRRKEMGRFVRESKRALAIVGSPTPLKEEGSPGRPPYDPSSMLLANLLRVYLKLSYRDFETLLRGNEQLRRKLGLDDSPGRDTLHRYAQTLTDDYLHAFNSALASRVKKGASPSPSTVPVCRSRSTQSVGALPRSTSVRTSS